MRISPQFIPRWLLSVALMASVSVASKDSDYYPPGMQNHNVKKQMYWKDSINVLQDLDQFESLYIQYHGCVWSKYGSRYGKGQDYDEQGAQQNQDDDDNGEGDGDANGGDGDYDNGCGGWGGEYFWYMGRTQCFKANVAYSLYGIMKEKSKAVDGSPCQEATYINSFFTTFGVESFSGPLGMGTDDANSQCTSEQPEDYEEVENYSYYQADDDYLDDNFYFYNWEAYMSYGTGCSAEGTFVKDSYQGAFCKGRKYVETLDTLDDVNANLEAIQCTQIYSSENDQGYNAQDYTDDDSYFDFDQMDAIELLAFSKSCSLRQYPHDCPDPYGLKSVYAKNTEASTGIHMTAARVMNAVSYICLALGLGCWVAAYMVTRKGRRERAAARQKHSPKGIMEVEMKKTTSSDSTAKDDEHDDDTDGKDPVGEKKDYGFEYVRTASVDKNAGSRKKSSKKQPPSSLPTSITLESKKTKKSSNAHKRTLSLSRFLAKKQEPAIDLQEDGDEKQIKTNGTLA